MSSSNQILTVRQMQAAEQALIDGGESISSLMERAGAGAAEWVWRIAAGRSVTVLCGPGNNGGDGYVIARILRERGLPVSLVAPLAARTAAAIAARDALGIEPVGQARGSVLVDCLFGSGLTRPLCDELAQLLRNLADAHDLVIAVDMPSGIESDTGALLNARLPQCHLTIALGAWKPAHWLMPAMATMGTKRLVDIGVAQVIDAAQLAEKPSLYAPESDAHKYSRGFLAVIGGAMPGAGVLAARAALHGGAGYVKLLSQRELLSAPDELVVDSSPLSLALGDRRLSALLIGPGLGRDGLATARLQAAAARDIPSVCDADALHLLTRDMLAGRTAPLIVTPHGGELDSLCRTFAIPDAPRLSRVQALAAAMHAVVVAKGPDTVIVSPDGQIQIAPPGSVWLSTAGTGDVLAGLVASRLATGQPPIDASVEAVFLHNRAAALAGPAFETSDLIGVIAPAFQEFM